MDLGLTRMPDRLTTALPDFAKALRELGIDPAAVEVSLAPDDWKLLDSALATEVAPALFEGVAVANRITVGGVRYLVRFR